MNGIIQESTLERMEEIRGKPIRRGLDKAINDCFDELENRNPINAKDNDSEKSIEVCDFTNKMAEEDQN